MKRFRAFQISIELPQNPQIRWYLHYFWHCARSPQDIEKAQARALEGRGCTARHWRPMGNRAWESLSLGWPQIAHCMLKDGIRLDKLPPVGKMPLTHTPSEGPHTRRDIELLYGLPFVISKG